MANSQQKQPGDGRALQRSQLSRKNKEELIDMILAFAGEDGTALASINKRMDDVVRAVDALNDTIASQNNVMKKNYEELKVRPDKQEEIIAKH